MSRFVHLALLIFGLITTSYTQDIVSDTLLIGVGNGKFDTVVIKNRSEGETIKIRSRYTDHTISIDKPPTKDDIVSLSVLNSETAPPKSWKFDFEGGLTGTQLFFMNWSAGGENSVAGRVFLNTGANFKRKRSILSYRLRCALGYQWRAELDKDDHPLRKTDDRLEFDFGYGYRIRSNFYYSYFLNFRSQFANGYNDSYTKVVSKSMAPAYLTYGLGLEYDYQNMIVVNISPFTMRHTFVLDSLIASLNNYGLKDGKRVKSDLGANISVAFKKEFVKRIDLSAKISLFSDYLYKPENIDINLEAGINFKMTKVFSTGVYFNYIYDDNVLFNIDGRLVPRSQFKESFWIGIVYKI